MLKDHIDVMFYLNETYLYLIYLNKIIDAICSPISTHDSLQSVGDGYSTQRTTAASVLQPLCPAS